MYTFLLCKKSWFFFSWCLINNLNERINYNSGKMSDCICNSYKSSDSIWLHSRALNICRVSFCICQLRILQATIDDLLSRLFILYYNFCSIIFTIRCHSTFIVYYVVWSLKSPHSNYSRCYLLSWLNVILLYNVSDV